MHVPPLTIKTMKNRQTIHDLFTDWGKNRQETPENNYTLKSEMLGKLPYGEIKTPVRSPLPWFSFALTAVAILIFVGSLVGTQNMAGIKTIGIANNSQDTYKPASASIGSSAEYSQKTVPDSSYRYPEYPPTEVPISDKREFIKTDYYSSLRTRHIEEVKTKIEIAVRGFGGRVDTSSSAERYGYVSFAIPANQLPLFKEEIISLVGEKFYKEQLSSVNLLPQKQSIEEQQSYTQNALNSLKSEQTLLAKNHNSVISSYQLRVNTLNGEINQLETELLTASQQRKTEIASRIASIRVEINTLLQDWSNENKTYQNKLSSVDSKIKNTENSLEYIKKQDSNLVESVQTVNGSVALNWISLWEMSDTYAPGPLVAWIILIIAIISYLWYRRYSKFQFEI